MEKILKLTLVALVMCAAFSGMAIAGDSVSLSVSCTIPAIPGVNVPPFDEDILNQRNAPQEEQQQKNENSQKEADNQILMAEITDGSAVVKTVYTR